MTETARIIMVRSCEECPYQETKQGFPSFCYGMMSKLPLPLKNIPENCPLEEIEIDLDDSNCSCDCHD